MGQTTEISWTDHTFNPWKGCTKVSPECDNCYAERETNRYGLNVWGQDRPRPVTSENYWKQPFKWNKAARESGERRRVFSGSWCDVMEDRSDVAMLRAHLYQVISNTPYLDWLLLTKRPQNFKRFLPPSWIDKPQDNVWGMTTVGVKKSLWRIDALRDTPFVVRGLSIEPLLEDLGTLDLRGIQWLIVGGESGHHARPMNPSWVRSLKDQAVAAGVAFHFKQHGEFVSVSEVEGTGVHHTFPDGATVRRVGKVKAGRVLDGRTWDELPAGAQRDV